MLYLKTKNEKGYFTFIPINEDEIYVDCTICGDMVRIENLCVIAGDVETLTSVDICERCLDSLSEIEGQEYVD